MPVFEVETGGRRFEVEAPDRGAAVAALSGEGSQSWGQFFGGLARQAAQGLTFSTADEIEAWLRSRGGGDYNREVERIRSENERFAAEYPGASLAANLVGGVVPFTGGPLGAAARWAARGSTLPRTMGRSAGLGAGVGAASGFGAGEGNILEGDFRRLGSAATGAGFGAGVGGVLPPVLAGAGSMAGAVGSTLRRAAPRSPREIPPIQPAGTPEPVAGISPRGVQFVDERTVPSLNAQEGAFQMISDWITRSGGTADDIAGAWTALQEAQRRFHGTGRVINAQTLAELYPPLQRLLRAGASGFTEVGEDATRFLAARHTGVLPRGASAEDLARRGIPTRDRFLPEMTGAEAERSLGTNFGVPAGNVVPTGAASRVVDFTKRMFNIKDFKHHGHASNASRTSDEILSAMKAESDPAYTAAFAAGDAVNLQPTIAPILERWGGIAADAAPSIGNVLRRGLRQFYTTGGGRQAQVHSNLRQFDSGKQALDDIIGDHLGKNSGRLLQQMKRELVEAVDNLPGAGPLYATARGIYSRGARDREILEQFKTAFKDDPDDVLRRYNALASDDERKLAELGITWGIEATNAGRLAGRDATFVFDTPNAMRVVAAIGRQQRAGRGDAEEVMRAFGLLVEGEREMVRGTAKTVAGGSMTDRNIQDALSMGAMEIAQNVHSWSQIWRGSQSLFEIGQKITVAILNRAFGLSADRAREISRILLTANPEEITAIIARLRAIQPPNRMARFNDLLKQAQRYAAGGAAAGGGAVGTSPPPGPTFV